AILDLVAAVALGIESLDGQLIPPHETPMARAVLQGESAAGAEAVIQNPDGKRWVARLNVRPLREPSGAVIGAISCFQDVTQEHDMRKAARRQQRTFDLAMVASKMGTWRYTIADNICVYDENAQQLYGLTEAHFLHDEAGVTEKFHPDDMALMWSRVAKALDPKGDGRYEVEYRVKQRDGSWRWLSAWGLVEFEGQGPERKPVAIAGASRDLTELKNAEQQQRLLVNELNHRVKNTLATIQSIAFQTLRGASDLPAARAALDGRIISLARAHDLLTERSWSGADLRDVIVRAMEPFAAGQIELSGPSLEISPKHALALSLALHELATNAAKYGALSIASGRVRLGWSAVARVMRLSWRESGGPPVKPPTRRGFGSRILNDGLFRNLNGEARLDYARDGVKCEISAAL
ncbi:MAG TPA: HWE histidine kinase domain-containing protein, partial [Stellaceae bacterium]|nr:HWE histidine kinase domain-containing protein [Stellaceae bacterium]